MRFSRNLYSKFFVQLAVADHLDGIKAVLDNACCLECFGVNSVAVIKLSVQCAEVNGNDVFRKDVVETSFRNTALQRHLTALKAGTDAAAGTGLLTLLTLAGGFSPAGAVTGESSCNFIVRTSLLTLH